MIIESFHFGSITIDSVIYGSDVIILPPRVLSSWWRREGHKLAVDDLVEVIAHRPDVLLVGCGVSNMMKVPESTIRDLESNGIRVEIYSTPEAIERFRDLEEKGEKVAAALHLTC
ncbi:MAG: Mth938-like domain-containing protein [bacterium]|nr:MAG: Mth938-like domain-containing protein [bacterium]